MKAIDIKFFETWRFQASGIDFITFLRFTARKKSDIQVIYEEVLFIFETTVQFFFLPRLNFYP